MKHTMTVTTPSDREVRMTRVFDAPRHLVFEAYTRPELLKQWLGVHNGWVLEVCEIDLRVGGAYRYFWRGPKGEEMGMRGVYREVVPPARIVATEVFDHAWYPGEAVGTAEMVESGGRTTLTLTVLYQSREARDGVLKSGMESGVSAGFDKMEELLAAAVRAGR
jgi:uncharacterized protein YndB with AHSA1/START domain